MLMPPGQYELSVSAPGFSTYNQAGISLDVNLSAKVNIVLAVGTLAEQVSVRADAMMVDSQSGTLRKVVTERDIASLPLNGRNAAELA
jgi:hypothetical protein